MCEVLGGVDLTLRTPLQLPVLNPLVSASRLVEIINRDKIEYFHQISSLPCENGCQGTGSVTEHSTGASDFQSGGKSSLDIVVKLYIQIYFFISSMLNLF